MKKLIALMLAVLMVAGLFAGCSDTKPTNGPTNVENKPTQQNPTNGGDQGDVDNNKYYVDYENNMVYAGSANITLNPNTQGGEVGYDVYKGEAGKDYTDPKYYTYHDYTSGMSNLKWSTHTWETSDDSAILSYITSPFYTFYLNSTGDGWSVACEMAAELPVDVTSQYVGQFGIEEGDTLQAWKIALNPNCTWEDGTPINADSYIYSAKELLDGKMMNRRADSLYAGDFVIYGAEAYLKSGLVVTSILDQVGLGKDNLTLGADGVYYYEGAPCKIMVGVANSYWLNGYSLATYVNAYGDQYFGMTYWQNLVDATGEDGYAPLTEETYAWLVDVITGNPAWGETEANFACYVQTDVANPEYSWDGVGFLKTGEYELVMIVTEPIQNPNYYVPYNLSSTYLVYEPLWESCKSWWDGNNNKVEAGSPNAVQVTTNYCTSKETTISYGAYKMSYFELDKQYNLVRNEEWYGYKDNNHLGMYQTDEIEVTVIANHATAMLAFASGEIMGVGLQQEDMETYGSSENLLYTPQSYTTKLTFNTDKAALEARGTQVLYNVNLRKAFSLSIDRAKYCSSLTAGHLPGHGLLNSMYVYDPFTGAAYRDTDAAKEALVKLHGLTYGDAEDAEYGDLDEAYEAITGYNPNEAREIMQKAYEECVADKLYDGSSVIQLELCVYASDEIYVKMFNFLNDALKDACVGTGFEGKLELKMKEDADYYETMYSGNTDIIFSTWGGAAYSPYTMLDQCYCDASDGSGNQMEYGFDTSKYMLTIYVNGHEFVTDLKTWAAWAGNKDVTITSKDGEMTLDRFGAYDAESRSAMFAKMEYAFLSYYATTPIYYRNSVSVFSKKINYATTKYVDLVGYGGIEFITYNYDDAEWEAVRADIKY